MVEDEIEEAKKELNVKYGYTDYDEMLKNKELDAIFTLSES